MKELRREPKIRKLKLARIGFLNSQRLNIVEFNIRSGIGERSSDVCTIKLVFTLRASTSKKLTVPKPHQITQNNTKGES